MADFGSTACRACLIGSLCIEGSSAPQPCPGGLHANQQVLATVGFLKNLTSDCLACPAGTACAVGSAVPTPCLPGSITNVSRQESCKPCDPGTFQSAAGETVCRECTRGFFCKRGAAQPTPCPGGTVGSAPGLTHEEDCIPVGAGFWAPTGSASPLKCPISGFFCPGRAHDHTTFKTSGLDPGSIPIPVSMGSMRLSVPIVETVDGARFELRLEGEPTAFNVTNLTLAIARLAGLSSASYGELDNVLSVVMLQSHAASHLRQRQLVSISFTTFEVTILTESPSMKSALRPRLDSISEAVLSATLGVSASRSAVRFGAVNMTFHVQEQASCPVGFWCTAGTKYTCSPGTYNPTSNATDQSACTLCPLHSTTVVSGQNMEGTPSVDYCKCKDGFYDQNITGAPPRTPQCMRCIVGATCHGIGTTLHDISLSPGYYRASVFSEDVRRCPDAELGCEEGKSSCPETTSGCLETDGAPCRPGLTGVYCRECTNKTNHYFRGATDSTNATCEQCDRRSDGGIPIGGAFGIFALVSVVSAALGYCALHQPRILSALLRAHKLIENFNLSTKLKILMAFYQVATKVPAIYVVTLPPSTRMILESFAVVVDVGLDVAVTPLECVGMHGYLPRLAFFTLMPFLLCLALVGGAMARTLCGKSMHKGLLKVLPTVLKLLFVAYPIVSTVAFQAYECETFDEGTEYEASLLRADYSVRCSVQGEHTPDYVKIRLLAALAVCLYPLGIPACYALLLLQARHSLLGRAKPTPLSRALAFLHAEYKPRFFWWELFETLRRFLLVGMAVVIWPGSLTQLSVGTSVALVFLTVQMQARPFRRTTDDFVALSSSLSLVVLFFCCILLKVGSVVELDVVSGSIALRAAFNIPTTYLSIVLVGSVVGSVSLAAVLLVYQLRDERRAAIEAARREEQEAKAKRLRYADGTLVRLDDAENDAKSRGLTTRGRCAKDGDDANVTADQGQATRGRRAEGREKTRPKFGSGHLKSAVEAEETRIFTYHIFLSHVWGTGQGKPTA